MRYGGGSLSTMTRIVSFTHIVVFKVDATTKARPKNPVLPRAQVLRKTTKLGPG